MAKKRPDTREITQHALPPDLLDHLLEREGLTERPVVDTPVERIDPSPFQPRRNFDEEELGGLVRSLQAHGFYGHLVARQIEDRYQIAYGERRLRAARQAGLTHLPLAVADLSDRQMLEMALTENLIRRDLNPVEEAEAYRQLAAMGHSQREISRRVGKSVGHINGRLSLLKREDVSAAVRDERIDVAEALEIAKVRSARARQRLIDRAERDELNARTIKETVRRLSQKAVEPVPSRASPSLAQAALRRALAALEGLPDRPEGASLDGEAADLLRRIIARAQALLGDLQQGDRG